MKARHKVNCYARTSVKDGLLILTNISRKNTVLCAVALSVKSTGLSGMHGNIFRVSTEYIVVPLIVKLS